MGLLLLFQLHNLSLGSDLREKKEALRKFCYYLVLDHTFPDGLDLSVTMSPVIQCISFALK